MAFQNSTHFQGCECTPLAHITFRWCSGPSLLSTYTFWGKEVQHVAVSTLVLLYGERRKPGGRQERGYTDRGRSWGVCAHSTPSDNMAGWDNCYPIKYSLD